MLRLAAHLPSTPLAACAAGIGKSIATKLAGQGLNVVLVALGDELLDATHKELSERYPRVTFRKVWNHGRGPPEAAGKGGDHGGRLHPADTAPGQR